MSTEFNRFIVYSFSSHLGLLFLIIFIQLITGFLSQTDRMKLQMSQTAIRVDVVAMPTMSLKELRALESEINREDLQEAKEDKVEKVLEEKSLETSQLEYLKEKEGKDKKAFLSMLKDLGKTKLDNKEQKAMRQKDKLPLDGNLKRELQKLIIAGNKVSKGSSLTGEVISDKEASEFNNYINKLPEIIRPFWQLPSYLKEQNLQCRIVLYLSSDGSIIKTTILETSGNDDYDLRALKSIQAAAPFPLVTPEIVRSE